MRAFGLQNALAQFRFQAQSTSSPGRKMQMKPIFVYVLWHRICATKHDLLLAVNGYIGGFVRAWLPVALGARC